MSTPAAPKSNYLLVKSELDDLLVDLLAKGERRLPSEDELSKRFKVSRPTVRSALLTLAQEGKISRVHGVGTLINRYAIGLSANLAVHKPFLKLLEEMSGNATLEVCSMTRTQLSTEMSGRLQHSDRSAIRIDRLFRVGDVPTIFSRDFVPAKLLHSPMQQVSAEDSAFQFLANWTKHGFRYSVAEIVPVLPPPIVVERLEVSPERPVLLLLHLHLSEEDTPVGLTEAYMSDDIRFSAVRLHGAV